MSDRRSPGASKWEVLWLASLYCIAAPAMQPLYSQTVSDSSGIGGQVVAFCQSQVGKQVGNGECCSLADAALESANAQGHSGSAPGADDYSWGDLAALIEAKGKTNYDREVQARKARPGDIIQFRDVVFRGSNGRSSYSSQALHHTAVVVAVTGYGKQIQILEQNSAGRRFVTKGALNVDDMREGWMRVYHPAAKEKPPSEDMPSRVAEAEKPPPEDTPSPATNAPNAPPAPPSAAFLADVGYAQKAALSEYPELGVNGSPLNRRFLARYEEWKSRGDQRLSSSDWPEKLAVDCVEHP